MNDVSPKKDYRLGSYEQPRRGRWLWRGFWFLIVAALIGAVVWWVHSKPAPAVQTGRFANAGPMPIAAATVEKGDVNIVLDELGTVTPLSTVAVKTQINGRLMHIAFKEGQEVKQGDLLAQIDSRPYEYVLAQAQGQLAKDQALLKNAQVDLGRYQTLVAQDSIAKQQLDTQEYLVRQYQGAVMIDQGQVDNAKLNIAYCNVVAPINGRVGLRQVDEGNYVQVSDPNGLVVLTEMQPIAVVFTVPEDNLPAITKRLRAGATLDVIAYDRSNTTQLATGKVLTTDNAVDPTTGTVKLKSEFANQDESLFPNQFVNIRLLVDTVHDAAVMPYSAVQRGAPGAFVYIVNADDTVSVRPVKLGVRDGERIQVLDGLAPGDKVVVDGADKLREGSKIELRKSSAASASAPADSGAQTPDKAATEAPATNGVESPAAGEQKPEQRRRPSQ
jgi:multidrug efflux system membrane fusion protein